SGTVISGDVNSLQSGLARRNHIIKDYYALVFDSNALLAHQAFSLDGLILMNLMNTGNTHIVSKVLLQKPAELPRSLQSSLIRREDHQGAGVLMFLGKFLGNKLGKQPAGFKVIKVCPRIRV